MVEKINTFYFTVFSIVIDITWTIFWSGKWSHVNDFEKTAHFLVVFLSWVGILLKMVVIFSFGLLEWDTIKSTLPHKLQEQLHGRKYAEQTDEV